ncbi:hypothetical protein BGW80DRAFT_1300275 [Lactifluus volemus]|nr:hypothetical protein BGW80DRAFT_1300275 [Lactifluus volemus]
MCTLSLPQCCRLVTTFVTFYVASSAFCHHYVSPSRSGTLCLLPSLQQQQHVPHAATTVLSISTTWLGPFLTPVPCYNGPSSWQTDNILCALKMMARRMYTTEETLASIKASENWENGPDTKKCHSSDVSSNSSIHPISSNGSTTSGYSSLTIHFTSGTPIPHSSPSFSPPYNLAALLISNGRQYVQEQL